MPFSLPPPARLALGAVVLAGFVDAVGFLQFQSVYVSFMSGNTTMLGAAAAAGRWVQVGLLGAVVGLFVAGVVLGGALRQASPRPAATVLLGVAALLALAAGWWPGHWALLALTLSMGMLNAAIRQPQVAPLSLTFVTGTLVRVGQGLLERLSGRPWPGGWGRQVLDWLALAGGALLGSLAWQQLGLRALLAAALWTLLLALLTRWVPEA